MPLWYIPRTGCCIGKQFVAPPMRRKANLSHSMKHDLPIGHSLSANILEDPNLLPRVGGEVSLTDVQHASLTAGVACGRSLLVVSPTSTGKTLIGIWALISWLTTQAGRQVVYLVTHRALARQKFDELTGILCDRHFSGDRRCIVLANGDTVEDGAGGQPEDPLSAPVLVATYEKYLALLAGAGIREDMSQYAVICDEIQILGDEGRGRNVEILMTLLSVAKWGQVVGLSAVLDERDARDLRDWFDVELIMTSKREKHLIYECRNRENVLTFNTDAPADGISSRPRQASEATDTCSIVTELMRSGENLPIVIFCMTRARVYHAARAFSATLGIRAQPNQALHPGFVDSTEAARDLSCMMERRIAFHTADLLEEEREVVEAKLKSGEIDVVFATSTLAAGVNFPFKTAVFDSWKRGNNRNRTRVPISSSEFQNMAGRAGRMGFDHDHGRIIFTADNGFSEMHSARVYLQPDRMTPLVPRISPSSFNQISLQLLSGGICHTEQDLIDFLSRSFSATREQARNQAGLAHWREGLTRAITNLREWGFVL